MKQFLLLFCLAAPVVLGRSHRDELYLTTKDPSEASEIAEPVQLIVPGTYSNIGESIDDAEITEEQNKCFKDSARRLIDTNPGFDQWLKDAYAMVTRLHNMDKRCYNLENHNGQSNCLAYSSMGFGEYTKFMKQLEKFDHILPEEMKSEFQDITKDFHGTDADFKRIEEFAKKDSPMAPCFKYMVESAMAIYHHMMECKQIEDGKSPESVKCLVKWQLRVSRDVSSALKIMQIE